MQGCLAPSEIPGVTTAEASTFGGLAEDLIFADLVSRYPTFAKDIFQDANNPAAYMFFLASKNFHFTESLQKDYFERVGGAGLLRVPDFLIHTFAEHSLYEVKPDSKSGLRAGMEKVGTLSAIYSFYKLPYKPGTLFIPRDHDVASFGNALKVKLRVRLAGPGLLVYKLCVESEGAIELATLAAILAFLVRQLNKQKGGKTFTPVDLTPAFAPDQPLNGMARTLGMTMAAVGVAVGWKFFWRAVAIRFAVRGVAAATLAAADGPLPIGDLIAVGIAIWTVVDIIRLSDVLWRDAAEIARREA